MMRQLWAPSWALVATMAVLTGCGTSSDQKQTAPVKGTVTHNGEPVPGGTVTLVPIAQSGEGEPGKPASAGVQPDGSFVLGTYDVDDGAVIGKHTVSFSPPPPEASAAAEGGHAEAAKSPYAGLVPEQKEVEIPADGMEDLAIKLVPAR